MSPPNSPEKLPVYRDPQRFSHLRDIDPDPGRDLGVIAAAEAPRLFASLAAANNRLAEAHHEATHDYLTGALNLRGLEEYLSNTDTVPEAILLVDGTNQKAVNDTLGYARGDEVIKSTYEVLKKSVRPDDVIARKGGDEFIVILNRRPTHTEDYTGEERRSPQKPDVNELINITTERIKDVTSHLLGENPDLLTPAVNFDIAVGGSVWTEKDISLDERIARAEKPLKAHKAEQHRNGQHRRI